MHTQHSRACHGKGLHGTAGTHPSRQFPLVLTCHGDQLLTQPILFVLARIQMLGPAPYRHMMVVHISNAWPECFWPLFNQDHKATSTILQHAPLLWGSRVQDCSQLKSTGRLHTTEYSCQHILHHTWTLPCWCQRNDEAKIDTNAFS